MEDTTLCIELWRVGSSFQDMGLIIGTAHIAVIRQSLLIWVYFHRIIITTRNCSIA